jgi:carboxypeptidase C (cathepsin A)
MGKKLLIAAGLVFCLAAGALAQVDYQQMRQRGSPGQPPQATPAGPAQPRAGVPPEEKSSVTHHSIRFGGQQLNYTATAATYVIKSDDGAPKAVFFFVAYTRDDVADIAKRPVSFVYNGGPGSASLFTHMGLGPRRIVLTDDGHGMPAPYAITDNDSTFLDATDLVFIDAVSTGYSRPVTGETPSQFYGLVQDATWFADFIYQYLTRNERWSSPKFLIGESYGTTRSAEMSYILQQRHQIYLNGIVLVSSVGFGNFGADDRSKYYLPSYAVSAWFHHLLPEDLQKLSIEEVAEQARRFAHGEYAAALEKGDVLTPAESAQVVKSLARLTGLSPKYIEETNLRINPMRWFKELLRDKRRTVGRLDARFLGMDVDAAGERVEYDASEASYEGAYSAMFHDYVRRELKWTSDLYYTITAMVQPWDRGQPGQPAEALRSALTQQAYLKVLVVCGYYDFATPFNGIEETVSHMNLEPPIRKNIGFAYYESGHMVYIDKKAREKLHKDVAEFIASAH